MKSLRKHQLEIQEANEALRKEIDRDTFLVEWLQEIEDYKPVFNQEMLALTSDGKEQFALEQGFRTWRQYNDAVTAANKLAYDYVHSPVFKRLWSALKEYDGQFGWVDRYGPHNSGVPRQLMSVVVDWYKLPKLTSSERLQLQKKVADLCDEILISLGQLTPAIAGEDPFSPLRIDCERAEKLMRFLRTPDELLKVREEHPPWYLGSVATAALESAGINSFWLLQQIKSAAELRPARGSAPTKINAKSAHRTYLIKKSHALICPYGIGQISGKYRLVADVVEAITGDVCTEEDVRKLARRSPTEDFS